MPDAGAARGGAEDVGGLLRGAPDLRRTTREFDLPRVRVTQYDPRDEVERTVDAVELLVSVDPGGSWSVQIAGPELDPFTVKYAQTLLWDSDQPGRPARDTLPPWARVELDRLIALVHGKTRWPAGRMTLEDVTAVYAIHPMLRAFGRKVTVDGDRLTVRAWTGGRWQVEVAGMQIRVDGTRGVRRATATWSSEHPGDRAAVPGWASPYLDAALGDLP